jgi:16S rRNA (adenine1518-N6/adenine1519-N6)-dimethyltransferase
LAQRMGEGMRRVKMVSTIPYSISGPLIGKLLEAGNALSCLVLTVQRELAGRITASPGGKDYGSFTIFCQYHARVKSLFTIPPSAFYPMPKVMSTVVAIEPRLRPPVRLTDREAFLPMVRLLFSHRRKTIRTVLKRALRGREGEERLAGVFSAARINPMSRPEQLGMEEMASLCDNLCAVEGFHRALKGPL